MDGFKAAMYRRQTLRKVRRPSLKVRHLAKPAADLGRDENPTRWSYATRERMNVMLAKVLRGLIRCRVWMRSNVPDRTHGRLVYLSKLGERQRRAVRPCSGLAGLFRTPAQRASA